MPDDDDKLSLPARKPDEVTPYQLAPEATKPAAPKSATAPINPSGKGLLDDFDEDADFSKDPDLERLKKGGDKIKLDVEAVRANEPFSTPGRGDARTIVIIAGAVTLAAAIAAGVTAQARPFPAALTTVYSTMLSVITGMAAIAIAAALQERQIGRIDLAAVRMFLAVAAFQFFFHINTTVLGRADECLLAAGAYWLVIMLLFRLPRTETLIVSCMHMLLVGLFWAGGVLDAWAIGPVAT